MLKSIQKWLHNNFLKKYGFGWLYRIFFLHVAILLATYCIYIYIYYFLFELFFSSSKWKCHLTLYDADRQKLYDIWSKCCPIFCICCIDDINFYVSTQQWVFSWKIGCYGQFWTLQIPKWLVKIQKLKKD